MLNTPYEAFIFDTNVSEFPVRNHWHPYAEMLYVLRGSIFVSCNETEFYVAEDDMFMIFPGDIHAMYASSSKGAQYAVIKFDPGRLNIRSDFSPLITEMVRRARSGKARQLISYKEDIYEQNRERFLNCIGELNEKQLGYDVRVHAELSSILVSVIRLWQQAGIDFSRIKRSIGEEEISLNNILEYIDRHIDENLKVEELAKLCNMSYSHFARMFRDTYGRSCKEQIELLKVEKSQELLSFTDMSLNDIGQELGFADCSHFIRIFKRWKGITPGQFRKRSR